MDVKNKVAIVTGASSGVGAETAVKLANLGTRVIVNYANSQAGAEQTVARIVAAGGQAVCVKADVSDNSQCVALVNAAVVHYGQLDILMNNAGTTTFVPHKALDLLTDDIWQTTLATNLRGPFYMSRAALPEMIKQGGGEIVMTSSIAGLSTHGSSIAYCASKAALNSLTKTLAKALGEHNVRVNAICPGLIDGKWSEKGWGEDWQAAKDHTKGLTALDTLTAPVDVADSLISVVTGADLMTGQIITIDGGFHL
jgi:3-oxoacyl-[acyl-carrier protein] reductase